MDSLYVRLSLIFAQATISERPRALLSAQNFRGSEPNASECARSKRRGQ
jgi:hypothetical protein